MIVSACSPIKIKKQAPVIPVKQRSPTVEATDPPKPLDIFKTTTQIPARESADVEAGDTPLMDEDDETNILQLLLNKGRKAREAQQWLRAQRILEQAIRIEPKNPVIFADYGDLYKQMGITDKAESMYKRALYLAVHNEKLTEQINEKLTSLSR